jgi:hypothetical protein
MDHALTPLTAILLGPPGAMLMNWIRALPVPFGSATVNGQAGSPQVILANCVP